MILHLRKRVCGPYEWLIAQLNGYNEYLDSLQEELWDRKLVLSVSKLKALFTDARTILGIKDNLGLILDEVQLLITKQQWPHPTQPDRTWNALQFTLFELSSRNYWVLLIGTAFTIAHAPSLLSSVAGSKGDELFVVTSFPHLNETDVLETLQSCLDLTNVDKAVITQLGHLLRGRARFAGFFVQYFARYRDTQGWEISQFNRSKSEDLKAALAKTVLIIIGDIKQNIQSIEDAYYDVADKTKTKDLRTQLIRLWSAYLISPEGINSAKLPVLSFGVVPLEVSY